MSNPTVHDSGDRLPVEHPLRIVIGGTEVATLLCTPERLGDLALGWTFAQGAVEGAVPVRIEEDTRGSIALIDAPAIEGFVWRAYCAAGLDAATLLSAVDTRVAPSARIDADAFESQARMVFERFREQRGAGGYHHAALFDARHVYSVVTDLSRHNAVDKVVGNAVRRGIEPSRCAIALSGRVTADIALKAARLGTPVVATRSLPTLQAVQFADSAGLMLVCRVLDQRRVIYGPRRLNDAAS